MCRRFRLLLRGYSRRLFSAFFQAGGLAGAATQVIELRAAGMGPADNLDFFRARRMDEEGALYADAIGRDAPHCKVGVDAASPKPNDSSLKDLHALTVAFHDATVDTDGIAWVHVWHLVFELLVFEVIAQDS